MFMVNPPDFVYFMPDDSKYYRFVKSQLRSKYRQLERADGSKTQLYVYDGLVSSVTEEQWKKFEAEYFKRVKGE